MDLKICAHMSTQANARQIDACFSLKVALRSWMRGGASYGQGRFIH